MDIFEKTPNGIVQHGPMPDGRETFDQRRARYAKEREAYVQAAKNRLGRIRPVHHDHDTWGGCDLCLWYEVYPDGNGPSVNQDRSGEGL